MRIAGPKSAVRRYLTALVAALAALVYVGLGAVPAKAEAKQVSSTITKLEITNRAGAPVNRIFYGEGAYLAMNWDASSNGANLHEGDYFTLTLPDSMVFPTGNAATDFDLYAEDGVTVIAKGHVDPVSTGGGTVKVTFTDYVEGRENIKGNIRLAASFNKAKLALNEPNTFTVTVNGEAGGGTSTNVEAVVTGPKTLVDEYLEKWSGAVAGNPERAQWTVRLNHTAANLSNSVISDSLSGGNGSEKYAAESFKLNKADWDPEGNLVRIGETVDLSDRLKISPDGRSFTLDMGDISGQYRLIYQTTYTPGTRLGNSFKLTSTEKNASAFYAYQSASSGGSGDGNLANKIKITKVSADDANVLLSGATFEIRDSNRNRVTTLTTGADGTATSGSLTSGTYFAKETAAPSGYQADNNEYQLTVNPQGGALLTVKNEPIRTSVAVSKKWVGPEGSPVKIRLLADGADSGQSLTLSADNGWSGKFEGLAKYKNGQLIKYTVAEDPIEGYSSQITGDADKGYVITNTSTEKITLWVHKRWADDRYEELIPVSVTAMVRQAVTEWTGQNDRDEVRPESVKIRLLADGADTGQSLTLSANNGWWDRFEDLPKYKNGQLIKYTVAEDPIKGYSSEITGDVDRGFVVTNTNVEKVSVPVTKKWVGPEGSPVTVRLLADGADSGQSLTLSANNGWSGKFEDLPKYDKGKLIKYTVAENAIDGYSSKITGDADKGYVVTNTSTEKISVPVTKKWVGPEGASATIRLLADGADSGQSLTLSADNGWAGKFEGLPKYKNGQLVTYTVAEDAVEGYSSEITGDADKGYVVTNTNTEKISVWVFKRWAGDRYEELIPVSATAMVRQAVTEWTGQGDRDEVRPESVKIRLLADGTDSGQSLTLSADNGWSGKFEGLPKYKNGQLVKYTVAEDPVEGYSSEITGDADWGFVVTNTNIEKVSVPVSKKWVGPEGSPVTVRLLADGADSGQALTLSADNGWSGKFEDLPKYKNGQLVKYTVAETPVEGYSSKITGDADKGYVVTNTSTEKISVPVTKKWQDENNRDGVRPSSVTVRLLADGTEAAKATLDESNGWSHNFEGLAKYNADGSLIKYTITEDAVPNYSTAIDGSNVTNSYTPGKTSLTVTKAWDDGDNRDGVRPDSVKVQLYADDKAQGDPVTLNDENGWKHTWTDLYQKSNGKAVAYTVKEVETPEGYSAEVTGDPVAGFTVKNTHRPEKVSVPVSKKWVGPEGSPVKIRLLADGADSGQSLTLSADNGWAGKFEGLAKYKNGQLIKYTVAEDAVEGYSSEITGDADKGFVVTNTNVEKVSVPVSKKWVGPEGSPVKIRLLADGADSGQSLTLSADNGWAGKFEGLPKYKNGQLIKYTVAEDAVEGYSSEITGDADKGFVVTNTATEKPEPSPSPSPETPDPSAPPSSDPSKPSASPTPSVTPGVPVPSASSGSPTSPKQSVAPKPSASSSRPLARTGAEVGALSLVAFGLLAVGVGAVALRRRFDTQ